MNNNNNKITVSGRVKSFRYAFVGIWTMISSQHNAWIHAAATFFVIITGAYFGLTKAEWCWIILAVTSVWTAETVNTAFEFLVDLVSPEYHPIAGKVKDVAAGAVLITAIGAALIGLVIMGPYALEKINSWR